MRYDSTTKLHRTFDSDDVEVLIEYEQDPYDPGVLSGPPEYCYPPSGGGVYIISVTGEIDGKEVPYKATEQQLDIWAREIEALPIEPDDSWADFEYERRRDEAAWR